MPSLIADVSMDRLLPLIVISVYLAVVLYIGIFAFRRTKTTGEDFFLAGRSIGPIIFFLALFATNMTSVAIGSSGLAYKRGIGIFGMMASISAFVIPISLFVIGTRLWALGKRFGHMTQVSYFRDRWDCSAIGTVIFLITAVMLVPYLIVSIVGGGTILEALTGGMINYHLAGAIVAVVVMANVFFGGMRGAVWVNVFQTILFLAFGTIAFIVISKNMDHGLVQTVQDMVKDPNKVWALPRTPPNPAAQPGIPTSEFLSYIFIPLSSIMFPHMAIMCFTAKKVTAFKKTVVLYPLCIMAIWLPCVFLGAIGNGQPKANAALAAEAPASRAWLDSGGKTPLPLGKALQDAQTPGTQQLLADVAAKKLTYEEFGDKLPKVVGAIADPAKKGEVIKQVNIVAKSAATDSVLLQMLRLFVPAGLAGLLAAGIISAVMGSDCHQILALSTMFTKDVFDYYGGRKRFGERGTVFVGRLFIIIANGVAYWIAWSRPPIFELAVSWTFSGFAALAPVMLAALFWKRSTKYGALAAVLFVAACILGTGYLENHPTQLPHWIIGGKEAFALSKAGRLSIAGYLPVVYEVLGSAACMILFSLLTPRPSAATIAKYFPPRGRTGTGEGFEVIAPAAGASIA